MEEAFDFTKYFKNDFPLLWLFLSCHNNNGSSVSINFSSGFVYVCADEHGQFLAARCLYLLAPWCRVLLEKLTGLQLVKKFPAIHGTRRFITALTSLSLSWASPIQSIYPHPTSWRSILILSTHLRLGLPSGLFSIKTACVGPLMHMCNIKLQINKGSVFKLFFASGEQVCGAVSVEAG